MDNPEFCKTCCCGSCLKPTPHGGYECINCEMCDESFMHKPKCKDFIFDYKLLALDENKKIS